jgi:hypothetical protein
LDLVFQIDDGAWLSVNLRREEKQSEKEKKERPVPSSYRVKNRQPDGKQGITPVVKSHTVDSFSVLELQPESTSAQTASK